MNLAGQTIIGRRGRGPPQLAPLILPTSPVPVFTPWPSNDLRASWAADGRRTPSTEFISIKLASDCSREYIPRIELGKGESSEVYIAQHRHTGEWVILKVVSRVTLRDKLRGGVEPLRSAETYQVFLDEVTMQDLASQWHLPQHAAAISPRVLDHWVCERTDGMFVGVIVSELLGSAAVPAVALKDVPRAQWPLVLDEVTAMVDWLHSQGVEHGDLTGGNVVVVGSAVYLIDYGRGRLVAEEVRRHHLPLTRTQHGHLLDWDEWIVARQQLLNLTH